MTQILEMKRGMVNGRPLAFMSRLLTEKTPKTSRYFFLFSALHFDFIRRSFSAKGFSSFFPRHSVFDRNFREFRLGLFFSLSMAIRLELQPIEH